MKKYLYIFKMSVLEQSKYISDVVLGFITFIAMMFIFLNLWDYMYQDSASLINGYSMSQMIWYVLVTECLWYGTRNKVLTNQVSDDIKSGTIAYNLNKPYNYFLYVIFKYLGDIIIKFIMYVIFGIILGLIFVGNIPFNIVNVPFIIITIILGIMINSIINITISSISFWIEDSTPFRWLYDKMILVVGTIFPIEMFPKILQPIIKCTPIFVVTYGPAKLVVDFSMHMFYEILLAQIIYLIISSLLLWYIYKRGVKKLNVNGG